MTFMESETIELKSSVVADLCKEVIAFANTRGSALYIGVEDKLFAVISVLLSAVCAWICSWWT